jgi:MFS family permease
MLVACCPIHHFNLFPNSLVDLPSVNFLIRSFDGHWSLIPISCVATFPVAMFSERKNDRKGPMVAGAIILIGSQIMLMEAPKYWVMCLARVLQGFGSTMVWVVGLALLCVLG